MSSWFLITRIPFPPPPMLLGYSVLHLDSRVALDEIRLHDVDINEEFDSSDILVVGP